MIYSRPGHNGARPLHKNSAATSIKNRITLPPLHAGQIRIATHPSRRKLVCCGRRWGKSYLVIHLSIKEILTRQADGRYGQVGIFCPTYKYSSELYREILRILGPHATGNQSARAIRIKRTGATIEFWTLSDPRAGRSRSYSLVCIDEAAFVPDDGSSDTNTMSAIWERAIMPTLLDRPGSRALVLSTPAGRSGFFYDAAHDGAWTVFHAPTASNPHIPANELELIRQSTDPLVWAQEFEAQFVDYAGNAFLRLDLMLKDGNPIEVPIQHNRSFTCVFGVLDTAFGGPDKVDSDGTAYIIGAVLMPVYSPDQLPHVYILDWGIDQISGDLLKNYLERVAQEVERWTTQVKAQYGSQPMMIEEKASGIVLLQQAKRAGLNAQAIDSKLVSLGKDARVLATSRYLNQGLVHITQHALEKEVQFKGRVTNHLTNQLAQYRISDKARHKKNDDLVDALCYLVMQSVAGATGI